MKSILRILITSVIVLVLAELLPGVAIVNYTTALILALTLGILNILIKPLLVLLTLPITILTFGLFMLVVNALILLLADQLISGFTVHSIWNAILFCMLLSVSQTILFSLLKKDKK